MCVRKVPLDSWYVPSRIRYKTTDFKLIMITMPSTSFNIVESRWSYLNWQHSCYFFFFLSMRSEALGLQPHTQIQKHLNSPPWCGSPCCIRIDYSDQYWSIGLCSLCFHPQSSCKWVHYSYTCCFRRKLGLGLENLLGKLEGNSGRAEQFYEPYWHGGERVFMR